MGCLSMEIRHILVDLVEILATITKCKCTVHVCASRLEIAKKNGDVADYCGLSKKFLRAFFFLF